MTLELTRRQFSRGAMALAGVNGAPAMSVSALAGSTGKGAPDADDAYDILLTHFIRTEEDALYNGATTVARSGGAVTWHGRQLETFLSELDMRVDVTASAQQVVGQFREFLRNQVETAKRSRSSCVKASTQSIELEERIQFVSEKTSLTTKEVSPSSQVDDDNVDDDNSIEEVSEGPEIPESR